MEFGVALPRSSAAVTSDSDAHSATRASGKGGSRTGGRRALRAEEPTAALRAGHRVHELARTRDLTESEARGLVKAFLGPQVTSLPHFGLDLLAESVPAGFYAFEATASPPNPSASPIIGSFAVNRATGDVWRLVVCRTVESPALKRSQNSLRKRIGLSRVELHRLQRRAPCEP
jgi:hypothetical protein